MDSRLLWGTVDMLILDVVAREPTYGYRITQFILNQSEGYFELKEGSLYPALHRLEQRGWVEAEWGASENNRRARFYQVTPAGRKALRTQAATWRRYVGAVAKVLDPSLGEIS